MNKYTIQQRELVKTLVLKGLSYDEIAEKTGMVKGSIATLIHRSKKKVGIAKTKGSITPEVFNLIKQLLLLGNKALSISKVTKVSTRTISIINSMSDYNAYREYLAKVAIQRARERAESRSVGITEPHTSVETKTVESKISKVDVDNFNILVTKLNALEYTTTKILKLLEDTQVRKFRLF